MSDAPQLAAPPTMLQALAGRWQIPLLGLGLLVYAGGMAHLAAEHRPISFAEEIQRVELLRQAGALVRANAYLLDLLKQPERPRTERATLHLLLVDLIHEAEQLVTAHQKRNARAIITNFKEALRLDAVPEVKNWLQFGDAHRWLREYTEAAAAYRQALRLADQGADGIQRRVIELELESGRPLGRETVAELDVIMQNSAASSENYLWALELKVQWLLEQDANAEALALVAEGRQRLTGTAERPALTATEAYCLTQEGTHYSVEAETLLRQLLNDWSIRDELWAKATWLLGRMEQLDERPQAALARYEDVLTAFQTGDTRSACLLGRAEALADLGQYAGALEAFTALREPLGLKRHKAYIDAKVVRQNLTTIGERLLAEHDPELGVEYLRQALALTDTADERQRAYLLTRMASGLVRLAGDPTGSASEKTDDAESAAPSAERRDVLLNEAGETYLALARLQTDDDHAMASSLESAASCFDACGQTDRVATVLEEFVREHPTSDRRPWALHRLGQTYQALRRYPQAAEVYETTINRYPRMLEAQASMVPLAECLLAQGGSAARRGVEMLTAIVDDTGPEPMFDPQAREYRRALMRLVDYYCDADDTQEPGHLEKGLARLEDALAMYPDDSQVARWRFLLGDMYRRSAQALRQAGKTATLDSAALSTEVDRRTESALRAFEKVIALLAPRDTTSLSGLEQTYLRAAYLNRADCWFDLKKYSEAIEAYSEAIWRYEDQPESIAASMQVVHCYQRLGQRQAASAALERLSWLLRKIPSQAFAKSGGSSSKEYWENMVARLQRTGVY